jgi:iron complex outermembrane receptor protein
MSTVDHQRIAISGRSYPLACLMALLGAPPLAHAQTVPTNELEEVVVTAQRREERLQDVPISISALGSEELAKRQVDDLSSLRGAVPGLSISHFTGFNASNLVAVRGISGQPLPIGGGQVTAMYLDGVYLSRPDAAFFTLDDVQRVEVLRGPQGTLYGRNATAGAINIITRDPGKIVEGGVDANAGSFGGLALKGSLSGPVSDRFAAGLSASYDKHDGYFTNTVTGNKLDSLDSYTVRAKLRYATDDSRFTATLTADQATRNGQPVFKNQYASVAPGSAFVGLGNKNQVSIDAASEGLTTERIRSKGVGLTMTYEVNDRTQLVSVSSLRRVTTVTGYDLDGTSAPALFSRGDNSSKALNQELRATITGDRLRSTLGVNYFREDASFAFASSAPAVIANAPTIRDATVLDAYALFGQLEYDVSSRVTLVGGLRANSERRSFSLDYTGVPPVGLVTGQLINGKIDDDVLIPSVGLNFKASDDMLLYVKASQGYQAPGFNLAPGFPGSIDTFDAEKVWSYEAGIKSQFLDRRLTFNAAAFFYDYKNIQVRSTTGVGITTIDNAATATVKGIEASLSFVPVNGLTLAAQVTFLDPKYRSFCSPVSAGTPALSDPPFTDAACSIPLTAPTTALSYAQRQGNFLNQAPETSGGISADYRAAIGSAGELSAHVDYAWESNVFYTVANEAALSSGGWSRLGARVGFDLQRGPEIYLYGKNLTDVRYFGYALRASPTLAPSNMSEPRTYGVGVRMRF